MKTLLRTASLVTLCIDFVAGTLCLDLIAGMGDIEGEGGDVHEGGEVGGGDVHDMEDRGGGESYRDRGDFEGEDMDGAMNSLSGDSMENSQNRGQMDSQGQIKD